MNEKNKGFMVVCKNCKNHIDIYSYNDLTKVAHHNWSISAETVNEYTMGEIKCHKCGNIVNQYTEVNPNHK